MKNHQKIKIPKGPQFRGGNAVFPFFIVALFILIAIVSVVQGAFSMFFILLPLIVFLINFILDFQGVEIDKEKQLVRIYKLDLFWISGQWQDLNMFYEIGLKHETYTIKEWTPYTNMTTRGRNNTSENVGYARFLITLENKNTSQNIILAERQEYSKAKSKSLILSEKIGLPFHDIYKERVQDSLKRRMI